MMWRMGEATEIVIWQAVVQQALQRQKSAVQKKVSEEKLDEKAVTQATGESRDAGVTGKP